ncbi:P-loop containing protein [Fusarium mexicanum]|uniref:P-loop containing protein n=1 Tax=Fusarium mexicanum TaxID=751941 RepID=A0A8H5JJ24_9HYPO|nr:P-loop containing protein [Fusarium mexicanum]
MLDDLPPDSSPGSEDYNESTIPQIEEAAIQFGFFLKRHAYTPYNNATIEYLDILILIYISLAKSIAFRVKDNPEVRQEFSQNKKLPQLFFLSV